MSVIEVFFDHTCPYCYRAHDYFLELLPQFPQVKLKWMPVEAHPRGEEPWHKPYEDLAVQGALFVQALGGDELAYHERIYRAHFQERRAVDSIEVLTECAGELGLPAEEFRAALTRGTYARQQLAANEYAYGKQRVWAVPTLVCGEKRLDAIEGVGVTKEQVKAFFEACGA
ncbi:MAG: DsbA family protein [Candidatus Limiplasma sp.]|nr:DsbA family protein [Candidatus Limiplasma sp.]